MPQYLVANYLPDDFDPSTVTEAMMEEIHVAQPRNDCRRHQEIRLRDCRPPRAAKAASN